MASTTTRSELIHPLVDGAHVAESLKRRPGRRSCISHERVGHKTNFIGTEDLLTQSPVRSPGTKAKARIGHIRLILGKLNVQDGDGDLGPGVAIAYTVRRQPAGTCCLDNKSKTGDWSHIWSDDDDDDNNNAFLLPGGAPRYSIDSDALLPPRC